MWFSAHAYAMHPKMTPAATETKGGARRVQKTRTAECSRSTICEWNGEVSCASYPLPLRAGPYSR